MRHGNRDAGRRGGEYATKLFFAEPQLFLRFPKHVGLSAGVEHGIHDAAGQFLKPLLSLAQAVDEKRYFVIRFIEMRFWRLIHKGRTGSPKACKRDRVSASVPIILRTGSGNNRMSVGRQHDTVRQRALRMTEHIDDFDMMTIDQALAAERLKIGDRL